MIDRRDMLKLMATGVMGAVVVGGMTTMRDGAAPTAAEGVRFSVEGDMGVVRASLAGETIRVSGNFAERTVFALG